MFGEKEKIKIIKHRLLISPGIISLSYLFDLHYHILNIFSYSLAFISDQAEDDDYTALFTLTPVNTPSEKQR